MYSSTSSASTRAGVDAVALLLFLLINTPIPQTIRSTATAKHPTICFFFTFPPPVDPEFSRKYAKDVWLFLLLSFDPHGRILLFLHVQKNLARLFYTLLRFVFPFFFVFFWSLFAQASQGNRPCLFWNKPKDHLRTPTHPSASILSFSVDPSCYLVPYVSHFLTFPRPLPYMFSIRGFWGKPATLPEISKNALHA